MATTRPSGGLLSVIEVQLKFRNHPSRFVLNLWFMVVVFAVAAVTMYFYVQSQRQLSTEQTRRVESFRLASEVRQSSDDITRFVRTFVITGDEIYEDHMQEVINIRDGVVPRPEGYDNVYWDLVLKDNKRPTGQGKAVKLTDRLSKAGFTKEELGKLIESLKNSDRLVQRERNAIDLIKKEIPTPIENRNEAISMLHDDTYHREKSNIMQPILEFESMMNERTQQAVDTASARVELLRWILIGCGVALILLVFSASRSLKAVLGASIGYLYQRIDMIGKGDFSDPISVAPAYQHSVLGHLAQTQNQLATLEHNRSQAEETQRAVERRFYDIAAASSDWIWEADADWNFTYISDSVTERLGYSAEEMLGQSPLGFVPKSERDAVRRELERAVKIEDSFDEIRVPMQAQDGEIRTTVATGSVIAQPDGTILGYRGMMRDVTDHERAERDTRLAAAALESHDGIAITDIHGTIVRVNTALVELTGYSADTLVGENLSFLKSNRHDASFYPDLWESVRHAGSWQGEVWDRMSDGTIYPCWLAVSEVRDDDGKITHYVATHFDLSDRKATEDRITQLAYYDQLTRLPNRAMFLDRVNQAMASDARNATYGAVILIDLDQFKTLNDTMGHDVGDRLLVQVGERIGRSLRRDSTVARLGGDEFAIVLPGLSSIEGQARDHAQDIAEHLLRELNKPFELKDITHYGTQSLGITIYYGNDTAVDRVMKQADLAMYRAKALGRNTFAFFNLDMETTVAHRASLDRDLREAVRTQGLSLHFQPQIGVGGRIDGAEALLRWDHPTRNFVACSEFIPIAEDTGLIVPIGQWVFEQVCLQSVAWAEDAQLGTLDLAVNVSPRQFLAPDFVPMIQSIVERTRVDPTKIKIELTENVLIDQIDITAERMHALKQLGFQFFLDDFGTGYSSLSYLKKLPFDGLKIDMSFVHDLMVDPAASAIVRTVMSLAETFGHEVVAEGVETVEQRDRLAELGCESWQGYLFSRPTEIDRFVRVVQSHEA